MQTSKNGKVCPSPSCRVAGTTSIKDFPQISPAKSNIAPAGCIPQRDKRETSNGDSQRVSILEDIEQNRESWCLRLRKFSSHLWYSFPSNRTGGSFDLSPKVQICWAYSCKGKCVMYLSRINSEPPWGSKGPNLWQRLKRLAQSKVILSSLSALQTAAPKQWKAGSPISTDFVSAYRPSSKALERN